MGVQPPHVVSTDCAPKESRGFPFGLLRMGRGHLITAWPGCELPAQCLWGREDEAEGFQWYLAGVERLVSRSSCLARLPFPGLLARDGRYFLELPSGLQLL